MRANELDDGRRLQVGVVIPFFQRTPGLLRQALYSICEQSVILTGACSIRVVVIDDSSPVPCADELEGFVAPSGVDVTARRQSNAGAGAARNAALSMLDDACDVVAFLDSDDTWVPDHLARALKALEAGADFYFCDAVRGEDAASSENADAPSWFISALHSIEGAERLFLYDGPGDLAMVKGMVPTSSAIVHRRPRGGSVRFPSRYFRFGEDQYYCLQCLAAGGKIAYSSEVEVICGRGVNIFAGNAPRSEGQRLCMLDEIAFRKDALGTLPLSPEAVRHVAGKLSETRRKLLEQGFWLVRSDGGRWIGKCLRAEPSLIFDLPRALAAVLGERRRRGNDMAF